MGLHKDEYKDLFSFLWWVIVCVTTMAIISLGVAQCITNYTEGGQMRNICRIMREQNGKPSCTVYY